MNEHVEGKRGNWQRVLLPAAVIAVLGVIVWLLAGNPGAKPGPDGALPDGDPRTNRVAANRKQSNANANVVGTNGSVRQPGNNDPANGNAPGDSSSTNAAGSGNGNAAGNSATNNSPLENPNGGPLPSGSAVIRVEVQQDGESVAAASVEVWGRNRQHTTTATDVSGVAIVSGIAAGPYVVRASANGSGQAGQSVTVRDGETVIVQLSLGPPLKLGGIVVDANGDPVSGARVRVELSGDSGLTRFETVSEADGSFSLAAPVATIGRHVTLTASAVGHGEARAEALPEDGFWRAELPELTTGSATLRTADGTPPTAGGRLMAVRRNGDMRNAGDRVKLDLTGDTIRWPDGMNPGEWTVLIETAEGSWESTLNVPRDTATDMAIDLQPAARLTVKVTTGADHFPLPDAHVLVYRPDMPGTEWRARTDANGLATFNAMPPGPLRIQANHPDGDPRRVTDVSHGRQPRTVPMQVE